MKKKQQQESGDLGMLRQLGISLDPMQQLSGLVNLINQTQAPGIQQQQFGEEMDFRQQQGDRGYEMNQAELQQRQLAEQNNQSNFGLQHGLQERQLGEQARYNDLMDVNKDTALLAAQYDRANGNKMDFMKLLMDIMSNPNGPGIVDPNVASQYMNQNGFQGLLNPKLQQQQKPTLNTTNIDKNISNEAFLKSRQQHTGQ